MGEDALSDEPASIGASTSQWDAADYARVGGFVAVVPIAAGLAIEQDHLYDIDRLLSRRSYKRENGNRKQRECAKHNFLPREGRVVSVF